MTEKKQSNLELLNSVFDLDKARYDLAMNYAKMKLENHMREDFINDGSHSNHAKELEYLFEMFTLALTHFAYMPNEKFNALIR